MTERSAVVVALLLASTGCGGSAPSAADDDEKGREDAVANGPDGVADSMKDVCGMPPVAVSPAFDQTALVGYLSSAGRRWEQCAGESLGLCRDPTYPLLQFTARGAASLDVQCAGPCEDEPASSCLDPTIPPQGIKVWLDAPPPGHLNLYFFQETGLPAFDVQVWELQRFTLVRADGGTLDFAQAPTR